MRYIPENLKFKRLKEHRATLEKWFKRTEYENPGFQWFYNPEIGIFCWNKEKKVGFIFSGSKMLKDKNLWLYIDGAEVLG